MPQPYNLNFGPWLPDLSNLAIQMPAQWGATAVPAADALNVYWADGAYRSIPAPAAIGPTLGTAILNATSWYDDSTGKEEIFAATSSGLFVLVDGTWTQLPVESNASMTAVGQQLTPSQGTPVYALYGIAPASQSASGTSSSYSAFRDENVSAWGSGSGVSAYNWFFNATSGGTWSIILGQGTDSCLVGVTGVAAGTTATATTDCQVTINGTVYTVSSTQSYQNTAPVPYSGTLDAGDYDAGGGAEYIGYVSSPAVGSLSPLTDVNGYTIDGIFVIASGGVYTLVLEIASGSSLGAGYFDQLQIGSNLYSSSSASYSYSSGISSWQWSVGASPFSSSNSVTITYPP